MPPSGWEHVRRVLVVRLDNVGDIVLLAPALRSLRAALPAAHVTLMASPAGSDRRAERLLAEARVDPHAPFVALAPGASCPARTYAPERFAEVARAMAVETALPVVVVGGARERDRLRPVTGGQGSGVVSLVGRTSVPDLAGVLRRASLVVANDSGPMHLADAFRRPTVVLFSGTDREDQWRPRSAPSVVLRRPTDGAPCYRFERPFHMECLAIPPDEVVAAAVGLLRQPLCVPCGS